MTTPKSIPTVRGNFMRKIELFNGVFVSAGGWAGSELKVAAVRAALDRWVAASFAVAIPEDETAYTYQCGGCSHMLALDGDYGLCANAASPQDGRVIFEHGGCRQHSEAVNL